MRCLQRGLKLVQAVQAGLGIAQSAQLPPGCSEPTIRQPVSGHAKRAKVSMQPAGQHITIDDPAEAGPASQPEPEPQPKGTKVPKVRTEVDFQPHDQVCVLNLSLSQALKAELKSGDDLDGDFGGVLDTEEQEAGSKKKKKKRQKQLVD